MVIPLLQQMLHILLELRIHLQQFFHPFVQLLVLFFKESDLIMRNRMRRHCDYVIAGDCLLGLV
jgi:hypothetical protein